MPPQIFTDSTAQALFLLQGLWGFFLIVLTWSMRRVLSDIEENTRATTKLGESVAAINLLLAGNFVQKSDLATLTERLRQIEHDLTVMETRDKYREEMAKKAVSGGE